MGSVAVALDRAGRDGTLEALRELRPRLEKERSVSIAEEALAAAIDLSMRFEPDRKLPEKAIELVEQAAERTSPSPGGRGGEALVTPLTIAKVLAERRRLPLDLVTDTLDSGMGGRILALEDYLRERVLGQEEAIGTGGSAPAPGAHHAQQSPGPARGAAAGRAERRRQDRDGAAPGRAPVRLGLRDDPHGHVGAARRGVRRAPRRAAQGPSGRREGRPAHGGAPREAPGAAAARRGREGPSEGAAGVPEALRRGHVHGCGGPRRRLAPARRRHDLQPRHGGRRPDRRRAASRARARAPEPRRRGRAVPPASIPTTSR